MLFVGAEEICVVGTFSPPSEVKQAATEIGFRPEHVEIQTT